VCGLARIADIVFDVIGAGEREKILLAEFRTCP